MRESERGKLEEEIGRRKLKERRLKREAGCG
jgi:hypothetical protein